MYSLDSSNSELGFPPHGISSYYSQGIKHETNIVELFIIKFRKISSMYILSMIRIIDLQ